MGIEFVWFKSIFYFENSFTNSFVWFADCCVWKFNWEWAFEIGDYEKLDYLFKIYSNSFTIGLLTKLLLKLGFFVIAAGFLSKIFDNSSWLKWLCRVGLLSSDFGSFYSSIFYYYLVIPELFVN